MSDYTWPAAWLPKRFQLRVASTTRAFTSPYTAGMQVLDLMADYWRCELDMTPDNSTALGGQIEAFFDRLKGNANRILLWNLKRPAPLGTLRGTPTLAAAVAQLANTCSIQTAAGATLLAGDMLGMGGQLVRVMADTVANGSGVMAVEFAPRARAAIASGSAVTWSAPTAPFRLVSDGAPVDWRPGMFEAPSIELREDV